VWRIGIQWIEPAAEVILSSAFGGTKDLTTERQDVIRSALFVIGCGATLDAP
jgi:hypothetical protein